MIQGIRVFRARCFFAAGMSLLLAMMPARTVAQETPPTAPETGSAADVPQPTSAGESPADDDDAQAEATDPSVDLLSLPIRQRPYRIKVSVAFSGPRTGLVDRERVVAGIEKALKRMYGAMWLTEFEANDWLLPGTSSRLERLNVTDIFRKGEELPDVTTAPAVAESKSDDAASGEDSNASESPAAADVATSESTAVTDQGINRFPEQLVDKAFLITVESFPASTVVSCREYDSKSQELTPLRFATILDSRAVPTITSELIRDSFRPTLMFGRTYENDAGDSFIEMELQAGELPPPDPSAEQVVVGDVMRPFLRFMERRDASKLKLLQPLNLTYLVVTDIDNTVARGMVSTVLISHAPVTPFTGKGRRLQKMALRQRPAADSSRVKLVLRVRPDKPMVCHRIALAFKLRVGDEDRAEQTRLLSDRKGEIVVPVNPEFSSFWIYVYSGSILLARVPYAPGMLPYDVIELPDDSIRLGVEGELQLMQDELVDAVALREVFFSLAKKAADAGDEELLETHIESYKSVPGKQHFLDTLTLMKTGGIQKAQARQNRGAERFVGRMCDKMKDSLQLFFSDEKELARLRDLDALKAKAAARAGVQVPTTTQ